MLIGDILYRFKGDYSHLDKGAGKSSDVLGKTGQASDSLKGRFVDLQNTTSQLGNVFTTVFATVMAGGLMAFLKTVALTAARTQVLGTTLLVVGENAGYTRQELENQENSLKKLGITTQVARNTLVRMLQTQMDVTKAEQLANAARNLAVVSGKNTSATLQTLILGLVTLQTETLRTAGVTINLETESKKWAKANGVVYNTMTMMQRRQAALNAIVEQATSLDGAYVTAQKDLGKQLASFARYTEEASNTFGEFYLPALLQVVLLTRDLLKAYQALEPVTRRLISTVAVFVTGLGVLAAAFIGVLTLGPLLVSLFATMLAAFTPVVVTIAIVGAAVVAFGSLWSTNMWGVRDVTTDVWTLIKALFIAGATTVNNAMGSVMLSLKFLRDAITKPWKAGELFYELQEGLARLNSEVIGGWKKVGVATSDVYHKISLSADASNIALKEGTLVLTEEQIKQREVLRDYGVSITRDLTDKLKVLYGEELADFVKKEKKKFDVKKSLMAQALEIEARYVKGLYQLHTKELKQKASFEKIKLDLMADSGKIAETEALKRSYVMNKKLTEEEIALREENLKEVLVIMGKQQKPKEDIELARLKGLQEIEDLKINMIKAHLKYEVDLYKASVSEKERIDTNILDSLKHRHKMEEIEDQKAVDSYLMSQSEMLERKNQRDLESQNISISILKGRLDVLKAAGKEEGEEYKSLYDEYVAALNMREQAYQEHQNRLLLTTVKEEEKRRDIITNLRNESQLSQFRSEVARQVFHLHQSSLQEIVEMEKRVKEGQVPYAEFYAWKEAKEAETGEAIRRVQLESQRGTEEYIQLRIDQMTTAGATEKEISAEVFRIKRDHATSFVEGWKLGLEEMLLDTYTWADMSSEIVQSFAQNAESAVSTGLFDLIKTGSVDIYGVIEGLGDAMLHTITQALAKMAVQWVINQIASVTYSTTATVGLIAEQAQVTALIALYTALAAVKGAAGGFASGGSVPGLASGGFIPGYGGGDKVPIMAEAGEYVSTKEVAKKYFPVLQAMGRGTFPVFQGYQEGGRVEPIREEGRDISVISEAPEISIVNVSDPQEALKIMSSKPGEDVILNVLNRQRQTVRRILR